MMTHSDVIVPALHAYKAETERYLLGYQSWPLTPPVDPECCDTCRREHASWQSGEALRQALQERLDAINAAVSEYTATTEPDEDGCSPTTDRLDTPRHGYCRDVEGHVEAVAATRADGLCDGCRL